MLMPAHEAADLSGMTILVAEDTALVADLLAEQLQSAGCRVIGPAPRLKQGLALAATPGLDGTLLDVNLAGETCFPIADALAARGVPFAFLTGYGTTVLPAAYRDVPCLPKPYHLDDMFALVKQRFQPR
jgi:DNA-binding response OmpR family regulator